MSKKDKTLKAIFTNPKKSNIKWSDFVSLVKSLGGTVESDNSGSNHTFRLGKQILNLHRPHPNNEIKKCYIKIIREFLEKGSENVKL